MARQAQKQESSNFSVKDRFATTEPVLDADFVTIAPGLPTKKHVGAKTAEHETTLDETKSLNKIGMTVFGLEPTMPQPDDKIAFYGFGAILVALSFWVSGGHAVVNKVDMMPVSSIVSQTSTSQNSASEIIDTSWRVATVAGASVLQVKGIVRNSGPVLAHAKPVSVTVKHKDGTLRRYLLGQKGWTLGPGEEVVVSGRLDIASPGVASVVLALTE